MKSSHSLTSTPISRRSFALGSAALAALWSTRWLGAATRLPGFSTYPFQLGIASGDPAPDGVVIWTRLAPRPLEGGGMPSRPVEVSWQVADDESMQKVVRRGTAIAHPDWAHSIHVEVEGLRPDRWYWYQFKAGGDVSGVGRTRTLPAADAAPDRLRFAFASCQHYESGLYTAYEHLAREDVDLVFHLGDYIYESGPADNRVRRHNSPEIKSLDDYRNRYALYKADPLLQAAHAIAPWIVTWDDHEVDNNYASDISEEPEVSAAELLLRRAAAYKAYYEHMPLRRTSLPQGSDMMLYRRLAFGRLATFNVLDTRQYRTDQPCGDRVQPACPEVYDPRATILGARQREWLLDGLSRSAGAWNVLAQQVMMARVDRMPGDAVGYSMDQWPGYEADRRRVLRHFRDRRIANPVVLTGDIHTNWANELGADFDDPTAPPVAAEFVGTSITSGGDGSQLPKSGERFLSENPFVKYFNGERGYVRCEVTPQSWRTDYRTVEFVTRPHAPVHTRRSFVIESGRAQLEAAG